MEEGIQLAVEAVRAGIENDLGSGSQVDVCVIRQDGAFYQRAVVREQELRWATTSVTLPQVVLQACPRSLLPTVSWANRPMSAPGVQIYT